MANLNIHFNNEDCDDSNAILILNTYMYQIATTTQMSKIIPVIPPITVPHGKSFSVPTKTKNIETHVSRTRDGQSALSPLGHKVNIIVLAADYYLCLQTQGGKTFRKCKNKNENENIHVSSYLLSYTVSCVAIL